MLRTCLEHAPPPLTASGLDMRGGHPAEIRAGTIKRGSHASAPQAAQVDDKEVGGNFKRLDAAGGAVSVFLGEPTPRRKNDSALSSGFAKIGSSEEKMPCQRP